MVPTAADVAAVTVISAGPAAQSLPLTPCCRSQPQFPLLISCSHLLHSLSLSLSLFTRSCSLFSCSFCCLSLDFRVSEVAGVRSWQCCTQQLKSNALSSSSTPLLSVCVLRGEPVVGLSFLSLSPPKFHVSLFAPQRGILQLARKLMPSKFLNCNGFLFKVVHKIGRFHAFVSHVSVPYNSQTAKAIALKLWQLPLREQMIS